MVRSFDNESSRRRGDPSLTLLEPATAARASSSNVLAERCGSAKPRTHFSDAFVSYFPA